MWHRYALRIAPASRLVPSRSPRNVTCLEDRAAGRGVLVLAVVGLRVMGGARTRPVVQLRGRARAARIRNAGPVPVTVVEATRQDVPVYASALGTVTAMNTVTVSPQVGGQLMSLNFREARK